MKSKLVWLMVLIDVTLVLGYVAGSYYFSSVMIDSPTMSLADSQAQMEEALPGLALPAPEEVSIPAGEVTLAGAFYDNELDGRCAVLLLHGYTGTRYGALQYAPLFWDRGCDLLAYDARGHGASTPAYHTFGYYEKEDAAAAYAWLLERSGLQPFQVGVTGVSYGAATALQAAPLLPGAAFIIADSAYQDMRSIIAYQAVQQFGPWIKIFLPGATILAELRADFVMADVSPQTAVTQTTIPILLIHAKEDGFTPAAHSETIYARSHQATTELQITDWGAQHGMSIFADPDAFAALVDSFLAQYAPGFGLTSGR
ncbi:MAG: alpha/beta fold hydrolase [Ardenticatenaceae bacterium]|nr:alpha/beta fold hydrolase [Ardenticatenaceae bacterium]